ncbi:hypothetical protein GCM10009574_097900 [Streptomyces asiaticus]|uniref:Uncharacterized protein n=2 Tax=Streptomyces rhizosphaericus TaxID=114699 RepID=A0ABP4C2J4_9ACTN
MVPSSIRERSSTVSAFLPAKARAQGELSNGVNDGQLGRDCGSLVDAMLECGEAASGVSVGRGVVHSGGLTDECHAASGSGDGGVEQVVLEELASGGGQGDDDVGVFAALGAVDGQGVGVDEFVEAGEEVGDGFAVGEGDGELVEVGVDGGDGAGGSVEDAACSAVGLVADLQDAVSEAEDPSFF